VNLSRWRQGGDGKPPGDEEHLPEVAALGFRHVRLPVDPDRLLPGWDSGREAPQQMERLLADIRQILARRLSVIVDLHPSDAVKKRVAGNPGEAARLVDLWSRLAGRLSPSDPERVLLETLNEPGDAFAAADWHALQGRLIEAIRAAAPQHSILAAGARFSTIGDLGAVVPYPDGNVIYNFHFYSLMLFTHQGASWTGPAFGRMRGVPYPLTMADLRRLAEAASSAAERRLIAQEAAGGRDWDRATVTAAMARAGDWSRRHGRPVICTEFGAFRDGGAPVPDRLRYLADVRQALEAQVQAWTHWDFSGGFGITRATFRGRAAKDADAGALSALGL
jgi:aryl-phospho-beta-D-glucosidase BglC (GH1 family)